MPFTNMSHVVTVRTKEAGVGLGERGLKRFEIAAAVAGHPLSGEEGSAADSANGGGHAVLGEADSGGGEFVDVGCFDDRVSSHSQGIVPPIVGKKNDNVHGLLWCCEETMSGEGEKADGEERFH